MYKCSMVGNRGRNGNKAWFGSGNPWWGLCCFVQNIVFCYLLNLKPETTVANKCLQVQQLPFFFFFFFNNMTSTKVSSSLLVSIFSNCTSLLELKLRSYQSGTVWSSDETRCTSFDTTWPHRHETELYFDGNSLCTCLYLHTVCI